MLPILKGKHQISKDVIILELELNQALAEVTKLLHLILTIPANSFSGERLFSLLKHLHDYMRCFPGEEQYTHLVYISKNKDLLKKMKVECGTVIFYSKGVDEFAKNETKN